MPFYKRDLRYVAEKVVPKESPVQQNLKRPRKCQDRADMAYKELISIREQVLNRGNVEKDVCSVYGELLSMKLRKLDERTQQLAMHKVDNIMFDLTFNLPQASKTHSGQSSFHVVSTLPPLQSPSTQSSHLSQVSNISEPHSNFYVTTPDLSNSYIELQKAQVPQHLAFLSQENSRASTNFTLDQPSISTVPSPSPQFSYGNEPSHITDSLAEPALMNK
nr:unnamed protein product [Callosobruchus analis]